MAQRLKNGRWLVQLRDPNTGERIPITGKTEGEVEARAERIRHVAPTRTVVYDEPPTPKPPKVSGDALSFRALVRRLRRATIRYLAQRSRSALDEMRGLERSVDAALELHASDPTPPDPQGDLFTEIPAVTEYLVRNRAAQDAEAKRVQKREVAASKKAGFEPRDCEARGLRARSAFVLAIAKASRRAR